MLAKESTLQVVPLHFTSRFLTRTRAISGPGALTCSFLTRHRTVFLMRALPVLCSQCFFSPPPPVIVDTDAYSTVTHSRSHDLKAGIGNNRRIRYVDMNGNGPRKMTGYENHKIKSSKERRDHCPVTIAIRLNTIRVLDQSFAQPINHHSSASISSPTPTFHHQHHPYPNSPSPQQQAPRPFASSSAACYPAPAKSPAAGACSAS